MSDTSSESSSCADRASTPFAARGHDARLRVALLVAAALTISTAAIAAEMASIAGVVRDAETGEPLPGVLVTLVELERPAITDAAGRYGLRSVPPGPHHLTFRIAGYARHSLHALVPRTGTLAIDVALRVEPVPIGGVRVRSVIPVSGAEPPAAEAGADADRTISIGAIRHHPLLAESDAVQALDGAGASTAPELPSGVHVDGGAADQTAFLLDGIPVLNPLHAAGIASAWNPDALSAVTLRFDPFASDSPHALAAVVEGATLRPGPRVRAQASVSTTQARLAIDGPAGSSGTTFLLAGRSGLHDLVAPGDDPSYLNGDVRDVLAAVRAPLRGGHLRVLAYGNEDEIGAAAVPESTAAAPRHDFEWESGSLGAEWAREWESASIVARAWHAIGEESARWAAPTSPVALDASRRDTGALVSGERRGERATSILSLRYEHVRTEYGVRRHPSGEELLALEATTPIFTAALRHRQRWPDRRVTAEAGLSVAATPSSKVAGGRAQLTWQPHDALQLLARGARTNQFTHSLRNPESVVGALFPVEVYVGAEAPGVPVASADHVQVAAEFRPVPGVRLAARAYARRADEVMLVAPREGAPFATGAFTTGSQTARGVAIELAMSSARLGVLAAYGLQRVRVHYGDSSYVPQHGARHWVLAGLIAYPTATLSARLGVSASMGRRATVAHGALEWESCNLLDRGCEFGGSPVTAGEPLGGQDLPAYMRADLGVRQHWHVRRGGREAEIALFATYTNLLSRANLLTYARDPGTGRLQPVEMRPSGVLVAGVDVRF